jgi:hypothetical protein
MVAQPDRVRDDVHERGGPGEIFVARDDIGALRVELDRMIAAGDRVTSRSAVTELPSLDGKGEPM